MRARKRTRKYKHCSQRRKFSALILQKQIRAHTHARTQTHAHFPHSAEPYALAHTRDRRSLAKHRVQILFPFSLTRHRRGAFTRSPKDTPSTPSSHIYTRGGWCARLRHPFVRTHASLIIMCHHTTHNRTAVPHWRMSVRACLCSILPDTRYPIYTLKPFCKNSRLDCTK